MFQPPRCPHRRCSQHTHPQPRFFLRAGYYRPRCRAVFVPRFVCRTCRRGFSRQTFRADYRDHRPHLNARVFLSLATGLGLRQTARNVGLSPRCTELKFRKIARHLRRLNLNLRGPLPEGANLQFDELETYEGRRNTRPLSLPLLIERKSRFVIWGEAATIRPHGRMSPARRKALAEDEKRLGRRRDASRWAILRTLRRGHELAAKLALVVFSSDEKASYPGLARLALRGKRLLHLRTNSRLVRASWNPLFAINQTEAMVRDLLGRLRRESWLVSKKRRYLDLGLQLWIAYRNYVRRRFNRDQRSPAQVLGFAERRLEVGELLSWRQDWGEGSLHPLARAGTTVGDWRRTRAAV
jgi:transposase-like protein